MLTLCADMETVDTEVSTGTALKKLSDAYQQVVESMQPLLDYGTQVLFVSITIVIILPIFLGPGKFLSFLQAAR